MVMLVIMVVVMVMLVIMVVVMVIIVVVFMMVMILIMTIVIQMTVCKDGGNNPCSITSSFIIGKQQSLTKSICCHLTRKRHSGHS